MDKQALLLEEEEELGGGQNKATSPMPGVVDRILVKVGDEVRKGDPLFVVIAMKMEHVVKANADAVIENIFFGVGDNVAKDATVVRFAHRGEESDNNNNKAWFFIGVYLPTTKDPIPIVTFVSMGFSWSACVNRQYRYVFG